MEYKVYLVGEEEIDVTPEEENEFKKQNPQAKLVGESKGGANVNSQTGEISQPGKSKGARPPQKKQSTNRFTHGKEFLASKSGDGSSVSQEAKNKAYKKVQLNYHMERDEKANMEGYSDASSLPKNVADHLGKLPNNWTYEEYEEHANKLSESYASADDQRKSEIDSILDELEKKQDYLQNKAATQSNIDNADESIAENKNYNSSEKQKQSKEFVAKLNKPMPKITDAVTNAGHYFNAEEKSLKLLTGTEGGEGWTKYGFEFEQAFVGKNQIRVLAGKNEDGSFVDNDGDGKRDEMVFDMNDRNSAEGMDKWMRARAQDPMERYQVIHNNALPSMQQKNEGEDRYDKTLSQIDTIREIWGLEGYSDKEVYDEIKKYQQQRAASATRDNTPHSGTPSIFDVLEERDRRDQGLPPSTYKSKQDARYPGMNAKTEALDAWGESSGEDLFSGWDTKASPTLGQTLAGTLNMEYKIDDMDLLFSDSLGGVKMQTAIEMYKEQFPDANVRDLYDEKGNPSDNGAPILHYISEKIMPILDAEISLESNADDMKERFYNSTQQTYYEENLAIAADRMGEKWFIKGKVQKDFWDEFKTVRDEVKVISKKSLLVYDEYEGNVNEATRLVNEINENYSNENVDAKIKELKDTYGLMDQKAFDQEAERIKSKHDLTTESGVDNANAELTKLSNNQKAISEKLNKDPWFDEYKQKVNSFNHIKDNVIPKQEEAIKKLGEELDGYEMTEEELVMMAKVFGQNHDFGTVLAQELKHAAIDLGQGMIIDTSDAFVTLMSVAIGKDNRNFTNDPVIDGYNKATSRFKTTEQIRNEHNFLGKLSMDIDSYQERNRETYRAPVSFGEIEGLADVGEWALTTMAQQAPQLALMYATAGSSGAISLGLLGASSGGAKWRDMNNQRDLYDRTGGLYGQDYSFANMYANATFTGATEALSERITFGQVKKAKGLFKGTTRDMITLGFANGLRKNVFNYKSLKKAGGTYLKDSFQEGFSESVAQLSSNVADIVSGNKDVSLTDGIMESFFSGWVVSSGIKMPGALANMTKPFRSKDTNQLLGENAAKITALTVESGKANITPKRADQIKKEIDELTDKSNRILQKDIKRLDAMKDPDRKALIEIEKKNYEARKKAKEIASNPNLNEKQKKKQLKDLQAQVNTNNAAKDNTLNKYPPEYVDANYRNKINTMKQMADMAKEHGAPDVNIREVNDSEFKDGRSRHNQNMSSKQVKQIAKKNKGLVKSLQSIIKDPKSTKAEVADAKAKLKDAKQQVAIADNLLNSSDFGVMQPKFDDKGNIVGIDIMINKDSSIKNGKFNTAAHEFIHAVFANTLKFDPQMRQVMGEAIMKILTGKGVTWKSDAARRDFIKRVNVYDLDQQGEEMLTITAEMMIDGDITISKTVMQKIGDLLQKFANLMFGYDMSIKEFNFDKPSDIRKFLIHYHESITKHKPSAAIAKMLAKGANGKMFKDARTPKERKDQSTFSKNVNAINEKNPDWKNDFDQFTQNPDGTPKYETKEDFVASDDFWPAMQMIMDSKPLKNLIQSGVASETGIDTKQAMDDFVRNTLENIQDRFLGGLNKKSRNQIKVIEEQRVAGEITAKETADAISKIESNPKNFNKGFDASSANGSLFGWLTGVGGGQGKSVIYRARGDYMGQWKKDNLGGTGRVVSTETQIGEGQTIGDKIMDKKSSLMEEIDNADMTPRSKQEAKDNVKELKMVSDLLKLPTNIVNGVNSSVEDADIDIDQITDKDGKHSAFKNIRNLILSVLSSKGAKMQTSRKYGKPTSEKDALPTGPLFGALNAIAAEIGVDPLRILANQDLNSEQRLQAQKYIIEKAINEDGSLNKSFIKDILPDGADNSGRATGVAHTKLGDLYVKGDRAKVKKGARASGLPTQTKRTNITKAEVLDMFGINPDLTLIKGTKADGAIREFVVQMTTLAVNQSIVVNATKNKLAAASTIARLNEGKSEAMFSKDSNKSINGVPTELDNEFKASKIVPYIKGTKGAKRDSKGRVIKDESSVVQIIDRDAKSPYNKKLTVGKHMDNIHSRFHRGTNNKHYDTIMNTVSGGISRQSYMTKEEYNRSVRDNQAKQSFLGRFKYTTKRFINKNFLKRLNKNNNSKRLDLLYDFAKDIETYLQKHPQDAWAFAVMLGDTVNNQSGAYTRINIPLGFYLANKDGSPNLDTLVVEEHTSPQKLVANLLFNAARFNSVDKVMPIIRAVAMQGALSESDNNLVDNAGYKTDFPKVFYDEVLPLIKKGKLDIDLGLASMIRYAVPLVDKKTGKVSYINLNKYRMLDGRTIPEAFGIGIKGEVSDAVIKMQNTLIQMILTGKITKAEASKMMKKSPVKFLNKLEKDLKKKENKIEAGRLSLEQNEAMLSKGKPEVRGMSTFDFDDTLGLTKSGVRVRIPNTDGTPKPGRKVIFLAGGAGSGKGNVVSKLELEKQGFKIVNQDISLEWLKKNSGLPENMNDLTKEQRSTLGKLGHQARQIAKRKMMKYQGNADGVVVDGTGGSAKAMQKLVKEFQEKGYDVSMVFVETSLETSLKRNKNRKERSLLDTIVRRNHESVQGNKNDFKDMFGDTFMEVNTDNLSMEDPMPIDLVNKMHNFVSSYEKTRIDATEFAEQGDAILEAGGSFDFSEFDQVVDGKPGPLLDKAKQRAAKYGTKDMFVLTARTQNSAKAIHEFLNSQGLNIPIENITGLADSTGEAKAKWMLEKFAEGYNDMYFVDDATQNVNAVKDVLDQLDIKSKVVQAKLDGVNRLVENGDESMLSKIVDPGDSNNQQDTTDKEFNDMIERRSNVDSNSKISEADAKKVGGKFSLKRFLKDLYIPPSAEDFKGLMYKFLGRGKQGDADLKWFAEKLFKPFAKGVQAWNAYKQNMVDDYKALKKEFPDVRKSLNKKVPGTNFTKDTAIRVYLWDKAGFDIPGISKQLKDTLVEHVKQDIGLTQFADSLSKITKTKDGYMQPSPNWMMETIPSDLRKLVDKIGRQQFLSEWIENKNRIFTKDNLNKIELIYGSEFRDALENILFRMENGTNRLQGKDKLVNRFTEWINGSVGAIMFFNMRSALLQTISTVNFVNWSDNNIFKASKAFANQPQFWKDFSMLFNSDQLKQRRRGLQTDVSASELTKSFAEGGYNPRTVINHLLQIGFTPTQIADSFAIAFGGASMYRNRVKRYIKEGMSRAEAESQAMLDFQEIAEETQQSSREDLISQQQAGPLGRLVLAFQNVTMQYGRLTKKSLSDLVNGRGDMKTNISKILYYGAIQNVVFGALQSALWAVAFGDDEEEIEKRQTRVANQALDSFLKGTGLYGALFATLKNVAIQWHLQSKKGFGKQDEAKIIIEALNLSPPIGSKIRKGLNAYRSLQYNKGVSKELGFRVENPALNAAANAIEAVTNIPLARVMSKMNNLEEAITGSHKTWQRIALIAGWSRWDVNIKDEELEAAKDIAKEKRKEQKKIDSKKEKEEEKKELEKQGFKTVRCSGKNSSGSRCGMTTVTKEKSWKCMHHAAFTDGDDRDGDGIKEYQCTATTSSGRRCKNKTENESKKCYAHQ